ncbi:GGDEF domain-containing protein [Sphingomonas sp. RS6]
MLLPLLLLAAPAAHGNAAAAGITDCHAITPLDTPDRALPELAFDCGQPPTGYQDRSLWLRLNVASGSPAPAILIHQTRFDRLAVGFRFADGSTEWESVRSGAFGTHWRPGGQIGFTASDDRAALTGIVLRIDRLASHDLLRIRMVPAGAAEVQSGVLAALVGAALTLLLVGAIYNLSLALAIRRQYLAWQGAWSACMLLWGAVWSQFALLVVPSIAGLVAAQLSTLLASLAVTLAAIGAVTSLDGAVPVWLRRSTLALGIAVSVIGIPATLVRSAAIGPIGMALGVAVLAVLVAVAACLTIGWRRGSTEARDLSGAWAVPMFALALTQLVDFGSALWGGGAQIAVLFAAAWQTIWLSVAASRRLAAMRSERDSARAAEARASDLAGRDPLTGLYNRRGLLAAIDPLLQRAHREDAPVSLLLMDVDRFKSINDAYGHEAGDHVLARISERLRRWEGPACAAARMGGEEFAMMIVGLTGLPLIRFADQVRQEIAALDHDESIAGQKVTVSIGVAETRGAADFQSLYRIADRGLYAAKHAGRDRVHWQAEDGSVLALPSNAQMRR